MFMEQLHGTSGEERSLFSPFEVDVGDVDLPLLALAGDLPGHVGQDGEHEEGGVDEELHGAELLLVRAMLPARRSLIERELLQTVHLLFSLSKTSEKRLITD